jgi:hypothetical protein
VPSQPWNPPSPSPDEFDWIQLRSGERLKGELKVLRSGERLKGELKVLYEDRI